MNLCDIQTSQRGFCSEPVCSEPILLVYLSWPGWAFPTCESREDTPTAVCVYKTVMADSISFVLVESRPTSWPLIVEWIQISESQTPLYGFPATPDLHRVVLEVSRHSPGFNFTNVDFTDQW